MIDSWVEEQWQDICRRLQRSAEHFGRERPGEKNRFEREAEEFSEQQSPPRYADLLRRVREGAELAISWQRVASNEEAGLEQNVDEDATVMDRRELDLESMVDETLDESFPASDPPSWSNAAI